MAHFLAAILKTPCFFHRIHSVKVFSYLYWLSLLFLSPQNRSQLSPLYINPIYFSLSLSSVAQSCLTICNPMNRSTPGLPVHHQLPEFTQTIESVMPSNHLILCRPLLLPSIFPSIRVFSNESTLCIRWPEDWSFSFNISPSNEHPGLISFRMDWLDLLAVQGTLKSLLQHHSSKVSILRRSEFSL